MGLNLGFIGKKLDQYGGDIGNFFGGVGNAAAQDVGNAAGAVYKNVINPTAQAVGSWGQNNAPVLSQAFHLAQDTTNPMTGVTDPSRAALGVGKIGYQNSPIGLAQQAAGDTAASITGKPQVSFLENHAPVQNAAPVFGNKLLGQGLAAASIPMNLLGAAGEFGGMHGSSEAPAAGPVTAPIKPPVTLRSALADQSGYIGQPRVNGKFGEGLQTSPVVNVNDPQSVFNRVVDIKQELGGNPSTGSHGLEAAYKVEKQLADNPSLSKHEQMQRNAALENSPMVAHMRDLYQQQAELQPHFDRHFPSTGKPTLAQKLTAPLKNQGGFLSLSPDEQAMGKALGMTDKETMAAKAGTANVEPTAPLKAKVTHAQEVKAADQTAVQNEINRRATGENNPMKVSIPKVEAGDYAKARSNAQLASNPIDVAAGLAHDAVRRLNPEDKPNFFRAIEDPALVAKAKDPAKMQAAIDAWKQLSDRGHATDRALGGSTPYRQTYALHDWDLNPEQISSTGGVADPNTFQGVNDMARIHPTIAHGEAAGLKLKGRNPEEAVLEYGKSVAGALKRQALIKGITEADAGAEKTNRSFDLRNGKTLPVSEQGLKELRSMETPPQMGKPRTIYKTSNKFLKQSLLSISQFHPLNISVAKAGPSLAGAGHPIMAAKGVANTFFAISKDYSTKLQTAALKDGTVEAGARIGTPIKFGSDYASEGKLNLGKNGIGERTIFEQQMPAMHIQMVKGVMEDLKNKGISLDSPEARQAGTRINEIMGFVNSEVRGLDPRVQRGLSDVLLAPQFTRAKWATLKGSLTEKGVAGKYARSAVVGNTAALLGVQIALGALFGQKQDNWRDTLIRALIHPSVPTDLSDGKGGVQEFGLPQSYISEAAALGVNLTRGEDGRLGAEVKPGNIPGNIAAYGRNRLAVLPSDALKVATNTDYSNKPLYNPTSPTKDQAEQVATTLISGSLPIGAQGLAQAGVVKSHLPQASQQILNANNSGSMNPILKSALGAVGLSARTDKTVGPALATQQYFDARNQAVSGLNANDQAAFNTIHPASKNPVTGQYQVQPTVWDTQTRASVYLSHPNVLAADNKLNQQLAKNGQPIDPFFQASPQQQQKFLTYSTLNQQDPQKTQMVTQNPWITALQNQRSKFFASLPAGDPNKPKDPVAYPTAPAPVVALQNQYFKLTDPTQKALFIRSNPALAAQFAAEDNYNRTVRGVKNLPQYDQYPTASPQVQANLDAKNYKDPATAQYLQDTALYGLEKSAGQAAFQGQGFDQAGLKDIYNVGNYDISKQKMTDGTNQFALAGTPGYAAGATAYGAKSSGGSSGKASARFAKSTISRAGKNVGKGGRKGIGKVSFKKSGGAKVARGGSGKPKVSLKSSLV
jgi:hypothetical protein